MDKITRICRICLATEKNQRFDDFFDRRKDFAENLFFVSNICVLEVSTNPPALICTICQEELKVAVRIKKKALVADEYFKKILQSDEVKLLNDNKVNMLGFQAIPATEMVTEIKQEVDPADFNAEVGGDDDFNWPENVISNNSSNNNSSSSSSESDWNEENDKKQKKDDDDEEIFSFNAFSSKSTKKPWKKRDRQRPKQGHVKRTYVKGGTKDGICDICGINLTTKERLRNHIKVRHEIIPEEEFLKCPFEDCRKRFKIKLYLERHIANIHNMDEKPKKEKEFWPCSFCGIIFGSKTALKQHEYRHTVPAQEKKCHTFFCDICGFSSDKKIRVQYHIERIHLQLRKFKCKMCPADFVHSSLLQYHELRVHLNLRKFVCRYCDKSFTRSSCRLIHERIHTNERPYSCRFCERTFIHHSDYRRHELRHTGGVPIKQFMEQMKQGLVQYVN